VLPPGLEPGTTVPKTVMISVSPQERCEEVKVFTSLLAECSLLDTTKFIAKTLGIS
jgi:hypothetical protein